LWEGKDKSIRALERALDVLQALQESKAMELKDLRRATGPPKATLLRILTTLQSRDAALDHRRRPARRIRRGRARGCGVPD
jgi:DNA-binding IclR family transcriptional regulator